MALSVAVAALGIWVATRFYRGAPAIPERLAAAWPGAYRALLNKYWVDEIYGAVFVRGLVLGGGHALHATDRYVIDGGDGEVRRGLGVNGVAWWTRDVRGEGLEPLGPLGRRRRREPHRLRARQPELRASGPCRTASSSTTRSAC